VGVTRSHLGTGIADPLVVLQSLLDGEGWLTLTLKVIWAVLLRRSALHIHWLEGYVTYQSSPSPQIAAWLSLKIGSLLIIENATKAIWCTRWLIGYSFQGTVLRHSIKNGLARGSPQCLCVRLADRLDGRVLHVLVVARDAGSIIGAFVVVARKSGSVESVDDIGALEALLPKMGSTVSKFFIFANRIKRPDGHVSRISLPKRAIAGQASALVLRRRRIA
jgi:hypothetical protein